MLGRKTPTATNRPDPKEIKNAYRRLFATPDGKQVLQDLIDSFGGETFNPTNPDANLSLYRQGQRSVPDRIKQLLEE